MNSLYLLRLMFRYKSKEYLHRTYRKILGNLPLANHSFSIDFQLLQSVIVGRAEILCNIYYYNDCCRLHEFEL